MRERIVRDEATLLRELARGSERAFTQLYDQYWFSVYAVALKHLGSRDTALDTVQDVFSLVWNKRALFAGVLSFRYYLIAMARHAIFRKIARQVNRQKADGEFANHHASNIPADDLVLEADYQQLISNALAQLTPQQQQIFHMARVEGLSHKQIAARLDLSPLTIKSHMNHALSFLRKHLRQNLALLAFFLSTHQ